jgi:phage-related protein (TIGR01555 family)
MTDQIETLDTLRRHLTAFNRTMGQDSYVNLVSGLGVPGTSKSGATWFGRERVLQAGELQNLYQSNAYATRIVDRMVDDATRTDWTLTGVDKHFDWSSVKSQVDDLGGLLKIGDAWRWARLYGGGLVVMAAMDGRPFNTPLDMTTVQGLRGLATLDSTNVMVQGFFAASGSSAWSEPTGYQVLTPVADLTGTASMRTIHPSRVIRFDGCRVPATLKVNNGGWSPSVLQRCKVQLEAYGSVLGYAREIMHDLSVMVVGLEGFNVMTMGDSGAANAREILRQLKWGIDNLNLLVIDKAKSTYQEVKRSIEGLEKLILRFEADLVGASGMTRLILTGEQASGLGASSGDEVRAWYSSVQNEQKFTVAPALNRLLEVIFAIRRNRGEQVPNEWTIEWAPLTTPEPKANAEIAQIWMSTVQTGIMSGVISPDQGTDILVMNGVLNDLPGATDPLEGGEAETSGDLELAALPGAVGPVDPNAPALATEPEAAPVAEQALNGAQVAAILSILEQVSLGTLAPVAAEWVVGQAVPAAMATEAKRTQTREAIAAAAAQRAAVASAQPAAPAEQTAPQAPAAGTPSDAEEEEEENPIDVAWSEDPLPADAMTAKEIASTLGVKTGRVTRLVREGRLRQWNLLGKKVISLRDVKAIILEMNAVADAAKVRGRTDAATSSTTLMPTIALRAKVFDGLLQEQRAALESEIAAAGSSPATPRTEAPRIPPATITWGTNAMGVLVTTVAFEGMDPVQVVPALTFDQVTPMYMIGFYEFLREPTNPENNGLAQLPECDQSAKSDSTNHALIVVIRAPRKIAQWVPFKAEDESPPHVTVLHCKNVGPRQANALTAELQTLAREVAPFTITTGDVGYFDHDDQRVAWTGISGAGLHALHETIFNIAAALGLEISVHDGGYTPHLTLAYLPPGEGYDGASPPVGSPWAVDAVEVKYGDTTTVFALTMLTPSE